MNEVKAYTSHKKCKNRQSVILSVLLLFTVVSNLFAAVLEQSPKTEKEAQEEIRVRVFTLRHISTQQAKEYLQSAEIGNTILAIPGTEAISVTANSEELVFATTVIKVVDVNEKFDIRFIDIPAGKETPNNGKLEVELGIREWSIGTLMDGPAKGAINRAIVCEYKGRLLIVASAEQSNKVLEAIQKTFTEKTANDVNDAGKATSNLTSRQAEEPHIAADANGPQEISKQAEFTKEPVIIEANTPKETAAAEDDMLGGFINELSESAKKDKAKAQREAALAKAEAETAAKAEAEKQQIEQITAEREPIKQAVETASEEIEKSEPEPNVIKEAKRDEEKIKRTARLRKKLSSEPQPTVTEAKGKQTAAEQVDGDVVTVPQEPKILPELDIPNGEELLELNLPEKLDLVSLIDLVGKYLNLNYLYDETKVTGSVTIKVQGKLRVRELYNLLESVLKFRGFSMSRKGRLVTIVPTAEALEQDPTFAERAKAGDVVTTSVFHLKYITTATAKKLLGEMKLGSNITEIPETGTLVITEYAFRMQRIEDLLSLVDMPGPPRQFKLRVLNYTIAEFLVPKIQSFAEQLGTVDVTVGASVTPSATTTPGSPRMRRPQPVTQPQPQPGTETAKKTGVFIDFDKRTNRVLIIGLANELAAVEEIIDTLDVPQQDLRIIREYEIQYVDIEKIVQALGDLGIIVSTGTTTGGAVGPQTVIRSEQPGQSGQPAPTIPSIQPSTTSEGTITLDQPQIVKLESTNSLLVNATPEQQLQIAKIISYVDREPVEAAIPYRIYRLENQEPEALAEVLNNLIQQTVKDNEGKIQQTIKYTEENIAIVPDKNTFSLIVYASKKNQEWIGNLIKSLDRRRPQVLIDVSLVEITRDDQFQYDLDLVGNATTLIQNSIAIKGSTISSGFPATSPRNTLLEGGFTSSTGTFKGFYNSGKIQALLNLIDSKTYGRVLAKPKILVNDNEEGVIQTTDRVYVGKSTTTFPGGESNPIPVQDISWEPYEAKIELRITPQISEGDLLRLEITMTREDFTSSLPTTNTEPPPNYTTSNVNTIVTVPDGSTIILGGLTKLNQEKSANKIPVLGDIPIAGALFRGASKTDTNGKKLYLFVKANILRPEQAEGLGQLKAISQNNKDQFEKSEQEFQKFEILPGLKEKPMDPEKVLEQTEPNKAELGIED